MLQNMKIINTNGQLLSFLSSLLNVHIKFVGTYSGGNEKRSGYVKYVQSIQPYRSARLPTSYPHTSYSFYFA